MRHRISAEMTKHEFFFAFHFAQIYPCACMALEKTPAFAPLPLIYDDLSPEEKETARNNPAHYSWIIERCEAAAAELPKCLQKWILFGCGYDILAGELISKYGMTINERAYNSARIAYYLKLAMM